MNPLLRAVFVVLALLSIPAHAQFQFNDEEQQVKASLLADTTAVEPGKPFTALVRLQIKEKWHVYWQFGGDSGAPPRVEWELPAGFTAGEIQWPLPKWYKDPYNFVTYIYEGDLLLPVEIKTPATIDAKEVALKAKLNWLVCEEICVPGKGDVALTLPVGTASPANADLVAKVRATLPKNEPPPFKTEWSVKPDAFTVKVSGLPEGARVEFFPVPPNDEVKPKRAEVKGDTITVPIESGGAANLPWRGLLVSQVGSEPRAGWMLAASPANTVAASDNAGAGAPGSAPSQVSLIATLWLAFIGGMILNLMPCVFPVLGIKILGFVNQAGHDRGKVVGHGLVFTSGVLLSFWALAGVLAVLRTGGAKLGWGFQLQSPAFVFVLAVVMLVFALNMSGVFEFGVSATSVGSGLQMKQGLAGSFFTGVLATVVATPCSAPFLAPALGAALALSTIESFTVFTAIGIGLSTPYLLLSIFPAAVKVLPRPGAWMETFKQFMAFPLYGTVGYLVWVLAGQLGDEAQLNALLGLVLVALGVWFYGRWTQPGAKSSSLAFGVVALLAVGLGGLWFGWPPAAKAAGETKGVVWEKWSPAAVEKLRAEGRIVYVDFTARWCATCQTNKKVVFGSDEVLRTFADKKVATLRADWTNEDPEITAELAKYRMSAVPFNPVWLPGKDEPVILPALLTPGIVLDAIKQADPQSK